MSFRSANELPTEKSEVQHVSKFLNDHIDDLCEKLNMLKNELSEK